MKALCLCLIVLFATGVSVSASGPLKRPAAKPAKVPQMSRSKLAEISLQKLREEFNQSLDSTRIIAIVSPT